MWPCIYLFSIVCKCDAILSSVPWSHGRLRMSGISLQIVAGAAEKAADRFHHIHKHWAAVLLSPRREKRKGRAGRRKRQGAKGKEQKQRNPVDLAKLYSFLALWHPPPRVSISLFLRVFLFWALVNPHQQVGYHVPLLVAPIGLPNLACFACITSGPLWS